MIEIIKDTASSGFTTNEWYDKQLEGALALLGTTMLDVASYGARNIISGDRDSPKFLSLSLRNGRRYWFYNFEGWVQVAEVTTEEQLKEQGEAIEMMLMLLG